MPGSKSRFVINQIIRLVEKVPFVNLNQILELNGKIYVLIPKAGTRTIRDEFLRQNDLRKGDEWYHIKYVTRSQLRQLSKHSTVLIVFREPLESLQSCWKQKILRKYSDKNKPFYFWIYYPLLRRDMSFLGFLKAVNCLPDVMCEKHFRPLRVTIDFTGSDIQLIPIHKLSNHLKIEDKTKIANTTETTEIPQNCIDYFNRKLSRRFRVVVR